MGIGIVFNRSNDILYPVRAKMSECNAILIRLELNSNCNILVIILMKFYLIYKRSYCKYISGFS